MHDLQFSIENDIKVGLSEHSAVNNNISKTELWNYI